MGEQWGGLYSEVRSSVWVTALTGWPVSPPLVQVYPGRNGGQQKCDMHVLLLAIAMEIYLL